jgi:hypothetical protein
LSRLRRQAVDPACVVKGWDQSTNTPQTNKQTDGAIGATRKASKMSKVVAPLLSFSAGGQIAKTQVYSVWKGIPYVRRYVVPANPRTSDQILTRQAFTFLNYVWRIAPADFIAPWTAAAQGRPLTNRNLFLKQNASMLRTSPDLTGLVMSPGARGGLTSLITITPGDDLITFAGSDPSPLPSGWTVVKMVGVAIKQQDPQTGEDYEITAVSDSSSPYSVVMSGLDTATDYVAGAWWVYQRSASVTDLAYSASIGVEVTTT